MSKRERADSNLVRRMAESRGGRRNPGVAIASSAIAAASAIRRAQEDGELSEGDREALSRAREELLQVADSARIQVTETRTRKLGAGSVAQARLALQTLKAQEDQHDDVERRLQQLIGMIDALLEQEAPRDVDVLLKYFERLAERSLRSGSSTGEILIGSRER